MDYYINPATGIRYSFAERAAVFTTLASMIYIQGAEEWHDQYLQLHLRHKGDMRKVKSILKKHFGIDYYWTWGFTKQSEYVARRYCAAQDIVQLCKYFLENNQDLDYYNRYDPLRERPTISKRVYRYGSVRYDLLHV